jgi:hypothetical protein
VFLFYYAKEHIQLTVPVSSMIKSILGGGLILIFILGLKAILVLSTWCEAVIVGGLSFVLYAMWILVTRTITKSDLKIIPRIIPLPKWLVRAANKFLRD